MKSDQELFQDQQRASDWHINFAGKWCTLHTRAGAGIEGTVEKITDRSIYLSELLNVYPEIQPVMPREAIIESLLLAIPFLDVDRISTADRARAEKLCRALNTTHLVRPQRQN